MEAIATHAATAALLMFPCPAAAVPGVLPRPDATPPSAGKVQVYILAGQSNMVGFGYLQGSQPVYPSIDLSADPKIKVGRMPVGPSALLRHGVWQGADPNAPMGAKAAIYPGACQEGTDYRALKPVKQDTVALGTLEADLPSIDGPHTVVAEAFIDVPKEVYEKHLVHLIQDLRKEFKTLQMPAVVATVGFGGMEMDPGHFMTWEARMAVGDPKQHPESAGNVASVDTGPSRKATHTA
jgi:hypothetical protein